jgi:hypothetical protein
MEEIAKYIIGAIGGSGIIFLILFLNPEKIEKWSVILWKAIYYFFKKGEKKIVAHDIQGRVNEFARSLKKEIANFEPVGISIQWVTEKENPSDFFKENRLIIRMRQHEDQNKNFVYASMAFISKAVLTKTKKYLSPSQRESVDLFVGRKLLEKEKPHIVDSFFEDYYSLKALSNDRIMELLEKYEIIDKVGLFFPVLVQELAFLGDKVFYKPKNEKIVVEITDFVNFLKDYAGRETGEEKIPKNFKGSYCRCGIVIIAKSFKREVGDSKPYVSYMKKLLESKLENIYLIGSSTLNNRSFIDQISEEAQKQFKLEQYTSKKYKAKIKVRGERKEVDNYLVLLRSPEIVRYYDKEYQEKFIETVNKTKEY